MILLRFKTEKDKINGYYLLALKGTVRSLPGGLFEVNNYMADILKSENIEFEIVERNILNETEKIRNTPAIGIQ
ncbi:MAG: hypothetical protein AB1606_07845 [Nitrospirota bacterium]